MAKPEHFNGHKHKGTHTSVTPLAAKLVRAAVRLDEVTGISPGFIDAHAKSKIPRIQFSIISSGLKVSVLSKNSKQELIIFTKHAELVTRLLGTLFVN